MDGGRNPNNWYQTLHSDIARVLASKGVPPDVLDDVLADTAEAALRARERGSLPTITVEWLSVVARRRLVDHWRRQEGQQVRCDRVRFDRSLLGRAALVDAEESNPDWLQGLPERQRHALMLRYCDGCSVSEVASAIQVTYSGAESLLARGRANARLLIGT